MIRRAGGLLFSILILLLGAVIGSTRADDPPPVTLADLAAYRAALAGPIDPATARTVTFRDLWEHPAASQGKPVRVEGRVARLFRQPGVGQFPPLAEAWITSPRGEPICVVFPTNSGPTTPGLGDQVRFVGTFLRSITYPGGDTTRIAPLIVGPAAPAVLAAGPPGSFEPFGPIFGADRAADWGIGCVVGLGVLAFLARRHLNRPVAAPPPLGPAPEFRDGGAEFVELAGDHDDDH